MSLVLFEKQDAIGQITLNDPDKLNAMSEAMAHEFKQILDEIAADDSIRVIVLTGAGRAFSSGGNADMLKSYGQKSPQESAQLLKNFYNHYLKVREIPQPVIAMMNGHAIGAGFCLAMACDLRFCVDNAKYGVNFARIGLAPGMAGAYLLKHSIGNVRAAELLLTGKAVSGEDALRLGLVNDVCSADQLSEKVFSVAQDIARNAPLAVRFIKQALQVAETGSLNDVFEFDSKAQAECLRSQDFSEGIDAVLAKRKPNFLGK